MVVTRGASDLNSLQQSLPVNEGANYTKGNIGSINKTTFRVLESYLWWSEFHVGSIQLTELWQHLLFVVITAITY